MSVALQQNLNHLYVIGVRSRAQINGALRFSIQLTLRILGDCSWSSWNLQHIFQRSSEESLDANGCCWISVKWPRMRDKNDMIYSDYAGLPPFSKLDKCHLYPSLKRVTKHEGQATYTLLFKLLWWYHAKSEILPKIPCSWKAMSRSGCHTAVATWQKLSLPDMGRGFWVSGLYILTNRMDGWAFPQGMQRAEAYPSESGLVGGTNLNTFRKKPFTWQKTPWNYIRFCWNPPCRTTKKIFQWLFLFTTAPATTPNISTCNLKIEKQFPPVDSVFFSTQKGRDLRALQGQS